MTYSTTQARAELLDRLAGATDEIGRALAALGEAYEQVDEHAGDRLEVKLFRPVQRAYGRAQRTHAQFAVRHGLPSLDFEAAVAGAPSGGAKSFIGGAMDRVATADGALAELQDSMLPVEVGDAALRAGLAEVRQLLAGLRAEARELVRTLGR